jgi:hypothetical protein
MPEEFVKFPIAEGMAKRILHEWHREQLEERMRNQYPENAPGFWADFKTHVGEVVNERCPLPHCPCPRNKRKNIEKGTIP